MYKLLKHEHWKILQQQKLHGKAYSALRLSMWISLQAENTSVAKDRFKTGVTSFLEGLSKALVVEAEDLEKPAATPVSTEAVYDRAKARLHAIQVDPETYCSEPSGSPEKYKEWQKSFDLEEYKGEVSELLVSKVELRAFYTKLVSNYGLFLFYGSFK